jgi:hypothetical protein
MAAGGRTARFGAAVLNDEAYRPGDLVEIFNDLAEFAGSDPGSR